MPPTMASVVNPHLPIPDRMNIENGNRAATSNPKVETVFTAWQNAAIKMSTPQQFLASTYDARFCAGAKTDGDVLALSVCEYANEADATKGRDLSQRVLMQVAHRKVWRDKTTTLAIIQMKPGPDADALQKQVTDIFAKL